MRTATLFIAANALQLRQRRPHRRRAVIRMISERQIPAYVQTMKLYESETGVETKGPCGSATIKMVEHDGSHLISHSQEPLFSKDETQAVIDEAEERAARAGLRGDGADRALPGHFSTAFVRAFSQES